MLTFQMNLYALLDKYQILLYITEWFCFLIYWYLKILNNPHYLCLLIFIHHSLAYRYVTSDPVSVFLMDYNYRQNQLCVWIFLEIQLWRKSQDWLYYFVRPSSLPLYWMTFSTKNVKLNQLTPYQDVL